MKRWMFAATLAAATAVASSAFGTNPCKVGGDASVAPKIPESLQYSSNDTEVVVHRGRSSKAFERGFVRVDDPASFHCEAASGCLLMVHPQIYAETEGYLVCTYLDGHPMDGHWVLVGILTEDSPDFMNELVAMGDHTVRTKIWSYNPGTLSEWAITYTMYDQRTGTQIRTPAPTN